MSSLDSTLRIALRSTGSASATWEVGTAIVTISVALPFLGLMRTENPMIAWSLGLSDQEITHNCSCLLLSRYFPYAQGWLIDHSWAAHLCVYRTVIALVIHITSVINLQKKPSNIPDRSLLITRRSLPNQAESYFHSTVENGFGNLQLVLMISVAVS